VVKGVPCLARGDRPISTIDECNAAIDFQKDRLNLATRYSFTTYERTANYFPSGCFSTVLDEQNYGYYGNYFNTYQNLISLPFYYYHCIQRDPNEIFAPPSPPPPAAPPPMPPPVAVMYVDKGLGKCTKSDSSDPAHAYREGVGARACESDCTSRNDCWGYSVSTSANCFLWLDGPTLLGGGASWNGASCHVKEVLPEPPPPTYTVDHGVTCLARGDRPISSLEECAAAVAFTNNRINKQGWGTTSQRRYSFRPSGCYSSCKGSASSSIGYFCTSFNTYPDSTRNLERQHIFCIAPPPPPDVTVEGDCRGPFPYTTYDESLGIKQLNCVSSLGVDEDPPQNYGPNENCIIYDLPGKPLMVEAFDIEPSSNCEDDYFEINGVKYCNSAAFGRAPTPVGMLPDGSPAYWRSDGSSERAGWKICWEEPPPVARHRQLEDEVVVGTCSGTCKAGTFFSPQYGFGFKEGDYTCDECAAQCATCNGLAHDCTSCKTDHVMLRDIDVEVPNLQSDTPDVVSLDTCVEDCPLGQVANPSGECKKCNEKCSACVGTTSVDCTACASASQVVKMGKCIDTCAAGDYPDDDKVCHECPTMCKECTSASECTACHADRPLLHRGVCLSSCPAHTRLLDNECVDCHTSCLTCSGPAANECSECDRLGAFPHLEDGVCSCFGSEVASSDGKCVAFDECAEQSTCDTETQRCFNTNAGHECECLPGFERDGAECVDIRECTTGTHQCHVDAICADDVPGSYSCTCIYPKVGDGFLCYQASPPQPLAPPPSPPPSSPPPPSPPVEEALQLVGSIQSLSSFDGDDKGVPPWAYAVIIFVACVGIIMWGCCPRPRLFEIVSDKAYRSVIKLFPCLGTEKASDSRGNYTKVHLQIGQNVKLPLPSTLAAPYELFEVSKTKEKVGVNGVQHNMNVAELESAEV